MSDREHQIFMAFLDCLGLFVGRYRKRRMSLRSLEVFFDLGRKPDQTIPQISDGIKCDPSFVYNDLEYLRFTDMGEFINVNLIGHKYADFKRIYYLTEEGFALFSEAKELFSSTYYSSPTSYSPEAFAKLCTALCHFRAETAPSISLHSARAFVVVADEDGQTLADYAKLLGMRADAASVLFGKFTDPRPPKRIEFGLFVDRESPYNRRSKEFWLPKRGKELRRQLLAILDA